MTVNSKLHAFLLIALKNKRDLLRSDNFQRYIIEIISNKGLNKQVNAFLIYLKPLAGKIA